MQVRLCLYFLIYLIIITIKGNYLKITNMETEAQRVNNLLKLTQQIMELGSEHRWSVAIAYMLNHYVCCLVWNKNATCDCVIND